MDEDDKNTTPTETAQELEAEKEHLTQVREDELRTKIVSDYGFDPEEDKERIDRLVARELDHKIKLSQAVGQKIKYRTELTELKGKLPKAEPQASKQDKSEDLDERLTKALEKRDLEALEYPDDIKKAIARVADIEGISVRKAVSDPYVASRIEAWQKQQDAEEAALSRNNKTGGKAKHDIDNPPDFDMSTDEGRKGWDNWKKEMIAKGH